MKGTSRDPNKVNSRLKKVGSKLITTQACSLQLPKRLKDKKMILLGEYIEIFGSFAMVFDDGVYSVSSIMGALPITPDTITEERIDGEDYYNFNFNKGSIVIDNLVVIKDGNLVHQAIETILLQGKIPYFMDYEDITALFKTSGRYTGLNLDANLEAIDILISIIARSKGDLNTLIRHAGIKPPFTTDKVDYVGLANVSYGPTSNMNKILGNWQSDGITSVLISEGTEVSKLEELIRR